MRIIITLIILIFLNLNLYSQIKYIKKDTEKLLFDGYYSKKDSVKFNFTELLNATTSNTITKNLPLDNNPSCIDLNFKRSGTLFLSFSSYTSTYLLGVTSELYSATVVADVEFVTNSSTDLIISSHTFTISNQKPGTNEFNKHALNRHVLKVDIPNMKEINSNTISQINIKLNNFNYTTTANTNFTDKFKDEVNFESFYIEDLSYIISSSEPENDEPLLTVEYNDNSSSNSYTYDYINNVTDNNFRKIRLKWSNLTCDEYIFDNYQVQLLKVVNLVDKTNDNQYNDEFSTTTTVIDWDKATTFEIGNSNTFLDIYLTQGKGYYTWRVRPISYFFEGEMTNKQNYGAWNSESMDQGDIFDINKSGTSNTFYYLYYDNQDVELTDTLNWQHTRVFNEGDNGGSQHFDEIIYSDNLLGKRQYQKKLNHNDYEILSEFIPDHAGRAVLTSIPVPASAISNWEINYTNVSQTISHGTDLLYKNNVFGEPSKSFSLAQFDLGDPVVANDVVKNPSQIPDVESGNPNGLIMDYYNSSSTPYNVPKTQGYPYSRVIFYNNGTDRVKEEIIPDSYKYLQSDKDLGSVKYFYSSATQKELYSLFGKEAPDCSKVFKQFTKDENNIYHINYKDNKGNVIASTILQKDSDNHEQIQNSDNNKELLFEGELGIYPLNKDFNPISNRGGIDYEFNNKGNFFVLSPATTTYTYTMLNETLTKETCTFNFNDHNVGTDSPPIKIPYNVRVDVIDANEFYSEPNTHSFSSTTSNNFNLVVPASSTIVELEGVEPTNYSVNRSIKFDIDSIDAYFNTYRNYLNDYFYNYRFDDVFDLIYDFQDPSSTLTLDEFINEVDNLNDGANWVKTDISNTKIKLSFDFTGHHCIDDAFTNFEYTFNVCPSSTFPCGETPDYELMLTETFKDIEYKIIDGSNTFNHIFTDKIDDYFYRKFNGDAPKKLFLKESGENYIEFPNKIEEESYTYTIEYTNTGSKTYSYNNGAINKLIDNMLSETFTSNDYHIRNKYLYDSEDDPPVNYLDLDVEDNIWTPAEICDCWNRSISNFQSMGLELDDDGTYILNKDFDLLNDFLNCTGRMLRGFTNTAFLDEEIGIDASGTGLVVTNLEKNKLDYADTLYGGGYITNAHKYIWSDFVYSYTFNSFYTAFFDDLKWFEPSPTSNTATFIRDLHYTTSGSSTFFHFNLVSNAGTFTYDDPKNATDLLNYHPNYSLDEDIKKEELENFSFNTSFANISGEIQAFRIRPPSIPSISNNFETHLKFYINGSDGMYGMFLDNENEIYQKFRMQWEKLYYDWVGEDYYLNTTILKEDKDINNIGDFLDKANDELNNHKPDDTEFEMEDNPEFNEFSEFKNILLANAGASEEETKMLMLQYLSNKCIQACEIRDFKEALILAYYDASDNYLIEGDTYWTSPQGDDYQVEWIGDFPGGRLLDINNEEVLFTEFNMQFVSTEEIEDFEKQLLSACKGECAIKDCSESKSESEDDKSVPPGENNFESWKFTDIDFDKLKIDKKDADDNTTDIALNEACFESEYYRLINMGYYALEVQIPIRDCNGDQQICEYTPDYSDDFVSEWKTTRRSKKLLYEGKLYPFPETEEEYIHELKKRIKIIKYDISNNSYIALFKHAIAWERYKQNSAYPTFNDSHKIHFQRQYDINFAKVLFTHDVKQYNINSILSLKYYDPRFELFEIIYSSPVGIGTEFFNTLLGSNDENCFSQLEFLQKFTPYFPGSINSLVINNWNNELQTVGLYTYNRGFDCSNLMDLCLIKNQNFNKYTMNNSSSCFSYIPKLSGEYQDKQLSNMNFVGFPQKLNYTIEDNFSIEDEYIIHEREIFNRYWMSKLTINPNTKQFYNNLKEAVETTKLKNEFKNNVTLRDFLSFVSGMYVFTGNDITDLASYTINPNWSYDNSKNTFTGKGKFLEIPPYPNDEDFHDYDKFICYRFYFPENNSIKNDIEINTNDCEEAGILTFESHLRQYINDWTENMVENAKKEFNNHIEHFVDEFDEFKVEQDNQVYQKVTLMYYDNSNNLVQTTPPKGVVIDEAVNDEDEDVDETLETIYQYNSLGQIVTSKTPDQNSYSQVEVGKLGSITFYDYKGETIYIYDLAGRLRITVNPKQINNKVWGDSPPPTPTSTSCFAPKGMYYKYDKRGRLIETGEFTGVYVHGLITGQEYEEKIFTLGQYIEKYLKTKNTSGKSNEQIYQEKADFAKYNKMFEKHLFDSLNFPNDLAPNGMYPFNSFPTYQIGVMGLDENARFIGLKTITKYDIASDNPNIPQQFNLQNRISEIKRIPDSYHNKNSSIYLRDTVSSIYSYDIHGNVDWYFQDISVHRYQSINKGKLVKYNYDLLSGKVTELIYQDDAVDEFTQKFEYDADNRLITVASTRFDINVEKDVEYFYAMHGPLERKVLGNDQIQGIDYVYTIHGWLKGINSLGANDNFLGGDAGSGSNKYVPTDIFSMGLRYYENDFEHRSNFDYLYANSAGGGNLHPANPQYNGNIAEWDNSFNSLYIGTSPNNKIDEKFKRILNQYTYDISGRLLSSSSSFSNSINAQYTFQTTDAFSATFNYDLNGNMYDIERNNETGSPTHYDISLRDNSGTFTNQIDEVDDGNEIYVQKFDEMGQLISKMPKVLNINNPPDEGTLDTIKWTADGKIDYIVLSKTLKFINELTEEIEDRMVFFKYFYYYDGMGNRVAVLNDNLFHECFNDEDNNIFKYCQDAVNHTILATYNDCEECLQKNSYFNDIFVYEAGGKLLTKYNKLSDQLDACGYINVLECNYLYPDYSENVEWYVYGSASDGRVATVYPRFKIQDNITYDDNFEDDPPSLEVAYNTEMISNTFTALAGSATITGIETHRHLGEKRYEIKDHLGNVRAVTSDIKNSNNYNDIASSWKFLADVRSLNNYYPYGSLIDDGSWFGSSYNFGYNGMLKEGIGKDVYHTQNRTLSDGRWWSPDPLEHMFPNVSPYLSMGANPINFVDLLGLKPEEAPENPDEVTSYEDEDGTFVWIPSSKQWALSAVVDGRSYAEKLYDYAVDNFPVVSDIDQAIDYANQGDDLNSIKHLGYAIFDAVSIRGGKSKGISIPSIGMMEVHPPAFEYYEEFYLNNLQKDYYAQFENTPGVYIMLLGESSFYVGQSENIGKRMRQHFYKYGKFGYRYPEYVLENTTVIFYKMKNCSKYERELLETFLIQDLSNQLYDRKNRNSVKWPVNKMIYDKEEILLQQLKQNYLYGR